MDCTRSLIDVPPDLIAILDIVPSIRDSTFPFLLHIPPPTLSGSLSRRHVGNISSICCAPTCRAAAHRRGRPLLSQGSLDSPASTPRLTVPLA